MITLPFGVLWSVLYVVYVDGCLLALVTGVLELVYLQPLALRKNVHQSWPLALNFQVPRECLISAEISGNLFSHGMPYF